MRVSTFQYNLRTNSWSVGELPQMDSGRTLVLAFGATEIQTTPSIFQTVRARFPNSHILGCSTAGEILSGRLSDATLVVAVVEFAETRIKSASFVLRDDTQSEEAGLSLGSQLVSSDQPAAILLLSDGLRVDHSKLLAGLQRQVGMIPVIGALAADGQRYENSWVWSGERLQSGLVGAVGLYGKGISVQASVNGIWGAEDNSERVVTQSTNNIVYSIGGLAATAVCRGPGGVRPLRFVDGADSERTFASPLGVNEESNSIIFNRPIPSGSRVQVIQAEPRYLIDGATEVAVSVTKQLTEAGAKEGDSLAIANSGAGRRLFLGELAHNEFMAVSRQLPPLTPLIGLYSYGAISPDENHQSRIFDAALSVMVITEAHSRRDLDTANLGRARPSTTGQSFVDVATTTSLVEVRPTTIQMGAATVQYSDLGNLRFVAIEGTINETFQPAKIAEYLTGRIVLDLGKVELVTSFGVRGWLEMLSMSEQNGLTDLFLAHCSESIVNQMLMIRSFRGRGHVVSIGAPYICTSCSSTFEYLLDCEHSAEELRAQQPPDVACPSCGNRAVFDEDPNIYLDFLDDDIGAVLPNDVRTALAERRLSQMTEVDDAIEKRVEGERTGFRINRIVDEKVRWKRVLSGVEGVVRLDFARSKGATDIGSERFLAAIRVETDRVSSIILDQVPLNIVEHIIASEPIPKLQVRTLSLPARCSNCGLVRQTAVDPVGIREAARHGLQPESACRRCSGSVPISLPPSIVAHFSGNSAMSKSLSLGRGNRPLVWILGAGVLVLLITLIVILAL